MTDQNPQNKLAQPPHVLDYGIAQEDPSIKPKRIAFVICMWVCGLLAIEFIPVYPQNPEYWAKRGFQPWVHWAWLGPFCCGIASMANSVMLFRLPRLADKIGAVICILFVGFWPTLLTIYWWAYFL